MISSFLLVLLARSFAAEPVTPGAPPPAVAPPILAPDSPPPFPDPALVRFRAVTTLPVDGLRLEACATPAMSATTGTLVFQVQLQRGRVSLVSVLSADDAALPYEACLSRVLAAYEWPVRRARVRLPVTVEPVPAEAAEPSRP